MTCNDFIQRYSDYDDSLLSARELAVFRAHLTVCCRCARYDRVLRKGRMLARQLPPVEPGEDFVPRLHMRLQQLRIDRRRRAATPVLGGAATALAAITVVFGAMWALTLMDGASPAHPASEVADASPPSARAVPAARSSAPAWRGFPVLEARAPREWGVRRVDHHGPVTYSPLVTGPPVYRVSDTFHRAATSTGHTLD
jgi:predicted anti-sigma-YlaC factor YlaD